MITPDQAQTLLDGATPGPWHECDSPDTNSRHCDACSDDAIIGPDVLGCENPGFWMMDADRDLIIVAPDMAETIAGMTVEYALETLWGTGHDWAVTTGWFPTPERAWADLALDAGPTRLVRRLVGPTEVIDGE